MRLTLYLNLQHIFPPTLAEQIACCDEIRRLVFLPLIFYKIILAFISASEILTPYQIEILANKK